MSRTAFPFASRPGGLATLEPWEPGSLPLASIAYPRLRPDEQRLAIAHAHRVTLDDVRAFLHSEGVHSELRADFGTAERRTRLRRALEDFELQLDRWMRGERQCARQDWLVRVAHDAEEQLTSVYATLLANDEYEAFSRLHELLRLASAPRWTHFLSAGSLRLASTERGSHRARLERAFEAGARSIGRDAATRPWAQPSPMDALPTSWLYPFQPSQELGALIDRGYRVGLYNVGHFAVLDPALSTSASSSLIRAVVRGVVARPDSGPGPTP